MELGLTFPFQRILSAKTPAYGTEPDRRFCWDLHVIYLRGRQPLLDHAVNTRSSAAASALMAWEQDWRESLHHSHKATGEKCRIIHKGSIVPSDPFPLPTSEHLLGKTCST